MASKSTEITQISQLTQITGDIQLDNDIRIAGTLNGKLKCSGTLVVEPTGKIEGQIEVKSAIVAGQITGNVLAQERLVLEASSKLSGDITTSLLVIHEGARFEGKSTSATQPQLASSKKST